MVTVLMLHVTIVPTHPAQILLTLILHRAMALGTPATVRVIFHVTVMWMGAMLRHLRRILAEVPWCIPALPKMPATAISPVTVTLMELMQPYSIPTLAEVQFRTHVLHVRLGWRGVVIHYHNEYML
jgi:hypothetical protein